MKYISLIICVIISQIFHDGSVICFIFYLGQALIWIYLFISVQRDVIQVSKRKTDTNLILPCMHACPEFRADASVQMETGSSWRQASSKGLMQSQIYRPSSLWWAAWRQQGWVRSSQLGLLFCLQCLVLLSLCGGDAVSLSLISWALVLWPAVRGLWCYFIMNIKA